ncbi:ABC transporter substrate-binding protein [Allopusillimonas ginsengisoli]|nr:ABC transporter substrate-binding protein [Allopusillimonas ginsengisoli]
MTTPNRFYRSSLAAVLMVAGCNMAAARDLTIVNFGGANGDAQKAAFVEPLQKKLGINIISVAYNGEQAKVKAMVETNNVVWDAVEVETADLGRGCDEGLYEQLDWSRIGNKDDFIPEAIHDCGVGTFVWSTALAYNTKALTTAPNSWADFWDVEKFPGKRGMRKGARYNLEFALMADGVAPKEVYSVLSTPEGVDRAFKKLDELKPSIQWWEAGAQPVQMLAAGDVVMSTAYNGRIDAANREGQAMKVVWNESIYDLDYWVIPTGSPNKELAEKFIQYASSAPAQTAYAQHIAYGPINKHAIEKLDPKLLADMPTSPENMKNALLSSYDFWADHGEELDQRFSAWSTR